LVPAALKNARDLSLVTEEADRRATIGGLRFARRMFAAPALKQFVREESLPGTHVQSADELLDYARRNGSTCYHASCTCLMGSPAMAVVDDELKVHGLDGLRVIDASVMPDLDSRTGFRHREWQKCWRLIKPGRKCGAKL
jgi:choline dehydrogenase-like flavoprotein